jgi:hypothetical protein
MKKALTVGKASDFCLCVVSTTEQPRKCCCHATPMLSRREMFDSTGFVRHWKVVIQTLLLALVLATPGLATAAGGNCQDLDRSMIKAEQSKLAVGDCHESAADIAKSHGDRSKGSHSAFPSCFSMGMCCALTIALPSAARGPFYSEMISQPIATPITAYLSLTPVPDYPPPRA